MSKYNAKRVTVDGIVFDSKVEAEYYELLKLEKGTGGVKDFDIQPVFELQPKYTHEGKTIQPIKYIADFTVYNSDGTVEIVDIKGMETPVFKLKAKMFRYQNPDKTLVLLAYSKIDGGFITPEQLKVNRAKRKEERAIKKAQKEKEKAEKARLREEKKNGK